jgi:ATP-dependent protease ClpP protease subunit
MDSSSKRIKLYTEDGEEVELIKGTVEQSEQVNVFESGNIIHFIDRVDVNTIQKLINLIDKKISQNIKDVTDSYTLTYVVNSGGGCVREVLRFVDYIRMIKNRYPNLKLISVATGIIASAATQMCIIAHERHITKYAKAMIHELSVGYEKRNYTHIVARFKITNMWHNDLVDVYLEHMKKNEKGEPVISREELEKLLLIESWYTAQEYVDAGFSDKVI